MIYFYYNLFFKIHFNLLKSAHSVLVNKDTSFFLSNRCKNVNIIKQTKKLYLVVANLTNSLVFSTSKSDIIDKKILFNDFQFKILFFHFLIFSLFMKLIKIRSLF